MQDQAAKSARTRILEAAADLFYREGIRAVGVDAVIAHSGVAKMSLYRNFAGKDELVAAFLEYRDELYWEWWDKVVARHPATRAPRSGRSSRLSASGRPTRTTGAAPSSTRRWSSRTAAIPAASWRLPTSWNSAARLRALAEAVGAHDPAMLADQLLLVLEGTYVSGQTIGSEGVGQKAAAAAADALVDAACKARKPLTIRILNYKSMKRR